MKHDEELRFVSSDHFSMQKDYLPTHYLHILDIHCCVYFLVPRFFFVLFCGGSDGKKVLIISEERAVNSRILIVKPWICLVLLEIDVKRNNMDNYFRNLSWLSKIIFTFVDPHERIWHERKRNRQTVFAHRVQSWWTCRIRRVWYTESTEERLQ